ncbi:MAG: homocysteine S-methyltransferase family protein [Bacteroidales bacterium]|mgnify:FL=1|nr:homocysteine S-methyltransferase family protein [Bacteroidales bacterium]
MSLIATLQKRIMLLDGAMGTMLQSFRLQEKDFRGTLFATHPVPLQGCYDILNITNPMIVSRIHHDYLSAGSDIISTNTFNAQAVSLSQFGLEKHVREINLQAAKIARAVADRFNSRNTMQPRYVAGIIGPAHETGSVPHKNLTPGSHPLAFDTLVSVYAEQVAALMDGGVDLLIVETIFDLHHVRAALSALAKVFTQKGHSLPVMASLTPGEKNGLLLSGHTTDEFLALLLQQEIPLLSVGFNCSPGIGAARPYLEKLSATAPCFVHYYPAAGLPDRRGKYPETPAGMANAMKQYMQQGLVNIVGGCCGTTPEYVAAMAKLAKKYPPRNPRPYQHQC